jgi:hypothetical protein
VKSGFTTLEEALVTTSFKFELPSFFGRDGASTRALCDTRVLPVIKTHATWDPEDGHNGARHGFTKMVEETKRTMMTSASSMLTGLALLVAIESISVSASFLDALGNWITSQQRDFTGRGGSRDHSGMLILHCVRAIFSDLHDARIAGRGGVYARGPAAVAAIVWGLLQGLKKMREYQRLSFSAHPRLSHIINLHLQDNALMKHVFYEHVQDVERRLAENATEIQRLKLLVDIQVSRAAANGNAGGGGNQQRGGGG